MALNGTLEELAVLDVVQFVNQAHLSGALVLKSAEEEAALFYRKGGLVDARLGEVSGLEVLVRIVDWTAGSFVFHPGMEAPGETIRMDLHRAVMYALKARDERKLENEKRKAEEIRQKAVSLKDHLAELIAPLEFTAPASALPLSTPPPKVIEVAAIMLPCVKAPGPILVQELPTSHTTLAAFAPLTKLIVPAIA